MVLLAGLCDPGWSIGWACLIREGPVEWGLPEIVEGFGDPFGNRYTEERIIRRNGRMYFIYEDRNQMMDSLTGEWFPLPT